MSPLTGLSVIEDSRVAAEGRASDMADEYTRLSNPTAHDSGPAEPAQNPALRWGEGGVRNARIQVPEAIADCKELVLEFHAVAEQDLDEAVYSFMSSNANGVAILGADSLTERQRCGALSKGECVRLRWSVPNVFSEGQHFVGASIAGGPGYPSYDYWKQAASFTVMRDETTPIVVSPDTAFSFVKLDA